MSDPKSLGNCDASGTRANVPDVVIVGNVDMFQLLCKASSKSQRWMKCSKALQLPGGCLVQVTTQHGDRVAEALQWVPGVCIEPDINNGRKLVLIED